MIRGSLTALGRGRLGKETETETLFPKNAKEGVGQMNDGDPRPMTFHTGTPSPGPYSLKRICLHCTLRDWDRRS